MPTVHMARTSPATTKFGVFGSWRQALSIAQTEGPAAAK